MRARATAMSACPANVAGRKGQQRPPRHTHHSPATRGIKRPASRPVTTDSSRGLHRCRVGKENEDLGRTRSQQRRGFLKAKWLRSLEMTDAAGPFRKDGSLVVRLLAQYNLANFRQEGDHQDGFHGPLQHGAPASRNTYNGGSLLEHGVNRLGSHNIIGASHVCVLKKKYWLEYTDKVDL